MRERPNDPTTLIFTSRFLSWYQYLHYCMVVVTGVSVHPFTRLSYSRCTMMAELYGTFRVQAIHHYYGECWLWVRTDVVWITHLLLHHSTQSHTTHISRVMIVEISTSWQEFLYSCHITSLTCLIEVFILWTQHNIMYQTMTAATLTNNT